MKRKANYNVKHKPGGGAYSHDVPEKKPNPRLRSITRETSGEERTGGTLKSIVWGIIACAIVITALHLIL